MTVIEILKCGREVVLDNETDIEAFSSEWERNTGSSSAKMRTAKKITLTPCPGGGMAFKYE